MKKGDERKQQILIAAERLFCTKGYTNTSIQDILDIMHLSKGGFYHHFISKEALLECICRQRAYRVASRCSDTVSVIDDPIDRINTVLSMIFPLQREDTAFLSMLLPTLDMAQCAAVRVGYQDALNDAFFTMLNQEIYKARIEKKVFPVVQDVASPILLLINQSWYKASIYLLDCCKKTQRYEPSVLLSILNQVRRCVQVLLNAPYGSIASADLAAWDNIAQILMQRLVPKAQ